MPLPTTTNDLDKIGAKTVASDAFRAEVAQVLGMKLAEVTHVEAAPAGLVATTFDGVRMVLVPDDQPDGDGKTGWMLLVKPSAGWVGTQPVYVHPEADELEADAASITEAQAREALVAAGLEDEADDVLDGIDATDANEVALAATAALDAKGVTDDVRANALAVLFAALEPRVEADPPAKRGGGRGGRGK